MKVKVIKDSVIYQGKIYQLNDEFELDEVIAKSLMNDGYVTAFVEGDFKEKEVDSQEEQEAPKKPRSKKAQEKTVEVEEVEELPNTSMPE